VGWYKRYVKYHGMRHPAELGKEGVEAFLKHLAMHLEVAAGTQNQAFSALLFLYKEVLEIPLEDLDATRAKRKRKLPMVLSREEVRAVLGEAKPETPRTLLGLLYG
jgi:site-specific recombinase XerD